MTKYVEGQRFKVIKDGARFEGLLLFGELSLSGWSREIKKGEILTCLGWKETHVFGADVAGVMWTGLKVPDNALTMQIWPFESIFRPHPMHGFLEPYVDADDDEFVRILEDLTTPPEDEIDEGHIVDLSQYLPEVAKTAKPKEDEIVDLTVWPA